MNIYRPLLATVLFASLGACSDSAQFVEASGAKPIEAETIEYSGSVTDPSADAKAPEAKVDPLTGLPSDPSAPGTGGGSVSNSGGGTGSGGANIPGMPSPNTPSVPVADVVEQLKLACSTGVKKTLKQSIRFAETQKCNWGINGNLERRDTFVQAIEGQKASIILPTNAKLCELGIGSAATTIQYDDLMVLTMNNQVLLSSNKELLVGLQEDQDKAYVWDFSKSRGKAINFNAASYCLGDSSLCKVPETDVPGAFQFSIDPSVLGRLADNSADKAKLEFALYATGDNDDRDCWHTAFTLDFTLNYVQ